MPDMISPLAFAPRDDQSPDFIGSAFGGADWIQALKQAKQEQLLRQAQAQKTGAEAEQVRPLAEALIGLHGAETKKALHDANNPYSYLSSLSGPARDAASLEMVGGQYGQGSNVAKNALRLFNQGINNTDSQMAYRNHLNSTLEKRSSTGLGKTYQEAEDIDAGYLPGSGRSMQLSPSQQREYQQNYKAKVRKDISNPQAQNLAVRAANFETTANSINAHDLFRYAGARGSMQLALEQAKIAAGQDASPEYQKHLNAKAKNDILVKQYRQSMGDSVSAENQERLDKMMNPGGLFTNQKSAIAQYDTTRNLLKKEAKNIIAATHGTDTYDKGEEAASSDNYEPQDAATFGDSDVIGLAKQMSKKYNRNVTFNEAMQAMLNAGHQYIGGR